MKNKKQNKKKKQKKACYDIAIVSQLAPNKVDFYMLPHAFPSTAEEKDL